MALLAKALTVALAAGLITIAWQWWQAQPALRGRAVLMSMGKGHYPPRSPKSVTTFMVYMCVANARDIPVPIIDYEMTLCLRDGGRIRLAPYYAMSNTLGLDFPQYGGELELPMSEVNLLAQRAVVSKQAPALGVIVFYGDSTLRRRLSVEEEPKTIEVTVVDGFGGRHVIRTAAKDLRSGELMRYLLPEATWRPTRQ